jgi:hypothetical protein
MIDYGVPLHVPPLRGDALIAPRHPNPLLPVFGSPVLSTPDVFRRGLKPLLRVPPLLFVILSLLTLTLPLHIDFPPGGVLLPILCLPMVQTFSISLR